MIKERNLRKADCEVDCFFNLWSSFGNSVFTQGASKASRHFSFADSLRRAGGRALPITDHESPMTRLYYGWIWSVQRNSQVASALIATETAKSESSGTDRFNGPLPVSRRNIHGNKIMA